MYIYFKFSDILFYLILATLEPELSQMYKKKFLANY